MILNRLYRNQYNKKHGDNFVNIRKYIRLIVSKTDLISYIRSFKKRTNLIYIISYIR